MSKSKSRPAFALRVSTYAELAEHARAFADGHLTFLLVLGSRGLGKSRGIRQAVGDQAGWIEGNASPFGLYMQAYEYRNRPLVFDDIDGLDRSQQGVRLLTQEACVDLFRHGKAVGTDPTASGSGLSPHRASMFTRVPAAAGGGKTR